MIVFTFAVVVAVIEALLLWGKVAALKTVQKNLENSLASLVPSRVPWWVKAFDKLWRGFHFPAFVVVAAVMVIWFDLRRKRQLVVANEYVHALNFVTLVGLFWWISAAV